MTELTEQQKQEKDDKIRNGLMVEALKYAWENARDGKVTPLIASERAFTYCFGTTTTFWYKDLPLSEVLLSSAIAKQNAKDQ